LCRHRHIQKSTHVPKKIKRRARENLWKKGMRGETSIEGAASEVTCDGGGDKDREQLEGTKESARREGRQARATRPRRINLTGLWARKGKRRVSPEHSDVFLMSTKSTTQNHRMGKKGGGDSFVSIRRRREIPKEKKGKVAKRKHRKTKFI